jgi:hypothetical protein
VHININHADYFQHSCLGLGYLLHFEALCQMWFSLAVPRRFSGILCNYGKSSLRRQSAVTSFAARRWNADEDDRLKELCRQGYSLQKMSSEFNRSHASIDGRIRILKHEALTHTKEKRSCHLWSAEEDAWLLEKFEQGLSRKEITNLLPGRTYPSVRARLRAVRLAAYGREALLNDSSKRKLKYTDAFIQRFKDLRLKEAKTFAEIAVDLNCVGAPLKEIWGTRIRPWLSEEERKTIHAQNNWTPEETKHLWELQRRGIMVDDASLQFPSRSRHSVHCKITREYLQFPGRKQRLRPITAFKPAEPSAASDKDGTQPEEQG